MASPPLHLFLFLSFITSLPLCTALHPTQLIYQFPNTTFVENLAIRPCGSILTTIATTPDIYLIEPSPKTTKPQLIHHFDNSTSVTGITEICPDSFIIAVTSATGVGKPIPGSSSLYRVTFPRSNSNKAQVSLTAKIPNVLTPNGLVTLNENKVLIADSIKGVVWAVDTDTGASNIAISDPLFVPNEGFPIGVNGLKILGRTLYFTNSAQSLLGKVDIDLRTGAARGAASVVTHALPPGKGYDDFALSDRGVAFVTNAAGNFIERIDTRNGKQSIVAGNINSTKIAEPTSAALGRGAWEDWLFVTTGGGLFIPVNGYEIVGGQVVRIKLSGKY